MRWMLYYVGFERRGGHLGQRAKILRYTGKMYLKKSPIPLVLGVVFASKADDGAWRYRGFRPSTKLRNAIGNSRTAAAFGAYER
jgi:hypothetical protein